MIRNSSVDEKCLKTSYSKQLVNFYGIAALSKVRSPTAIALATQLDEIKIFKAVNFTVFIAQLAALKAQIPDKKKPQKVHWAFIFRLIQTWLNALNLTLEIVDLSNAESKALDNYLYANYLIIQCKEAAVRVSPQTWEGIEARMLLVPGA